ncbi:unnamed protein product [Leptosia nina]|uniref:Uncharacterized protein n=1 Tax=Leptosia nina TaxID=320188 RepID=A0AAV1JAX2_9NEOP
MIANLQETVSQLVYLKRDVKKLKDQIVSKDSVITAMEKENENTARKHKDSLTDLQLAHETQINAMISDCDKKVQQIQIEAETQIAQITFVAEEERTKTKEMESNHKDKMNEVVLQYEEKIQRQAASVSQLQEELARQAARSDANIEAYRRKLENLEEKLKQSQFKEYLAHSTRSTQLYESRGERPYSVERDSREIYSHHSDTMHDSPKRRLAAQRQGQSQKQGTLQVMYHDGKPKSAEKKGQFNISKKRKLYNANEFLNRSEF